MHFLGYLIFSLKELKNAPKTNDGRNSKENIGVRKCEADDTVYPEDEVEEEVVKLKLV